MPEGSRVWEGHKQKAMERFRRKRGLPLYTLRVTIQMYREMGEK
jgi:hypothetical protein